MPSGLINIALGLAIQVGTPGPSENPIAPVPARAYGQYGFEGSAEQRHPQDTQMNWVHGYHQEIPAYGGYATFRPNNYKDVLSQSQTAAGWGERPAMPYSQQFWHKYQDQASMLKVSRIQPAVPSPYLFTQHVIPQTPIWSNQPSGLQVPNQQIVWPPIAAPQQPQPQQSITIPASLPETLLPPSTNDLHQIQYRGNSVPR